MPKTKTKTAAPRKTYTGKPRGFAAMNPAHVKRIASMGGQAISANSKHMAKIGRKGGTNSHGPTNGAAAKSGR